jgi:hypothetical protein
MGEEDIKREIYRLRNERQLLETHCLGIGLQLPLWLSIRYVRCGKKGCKCNKGKLHGPFTYVSFKKGSRVYYKYISSKRLNEIRQYINNYHFFQEKVARLNEINRKITVLLKESQKITYYLYQNG